MRTKKWNFVSMLILMVGISCACAGLRLFPEPIPVNDQESQAPLTIEEPTLDLATSVADSPAAGICAEFDTETVTVTIYPDIPDPRCSLIQPEQKLEVVNAREETLLVSIGRLETELGPGESYLFDQPFGEYLAPGVHQIMVQPCCGAELWLKGQ